MPAPLNLELKQAIETRRYMEDVVKQLHGGPMLSAIRDCTLMVQGSAVKIAHVDTGLHRANITPMVWAEGDRVHGTVGTNLDYGPFAILDTKPHWPPISAIQQWVHRKGLGGTDLGHGRIKRAPAAIERSIAFLIARRISRKGTKGDMSIFKALDDNAARIVARINRVITQAIK